MAEARWGAAPKLRTLLAGIVAIAGLAFAWATPASAEDWTVGEITGPPGTTRVQPAAVNANAEVVGNARFSGRSEDTAFWWSDGTMIELPAPGGAERWRAYDINDNGLIVGFTLDEDTGESVPAVNGITWTVDEGVGSYQLTAYNLGGADDGGFREGSVAFGVNNAGQVVGRANYGWEHEKYGFRDVNVPAFGNGLSWNRLALPDVETETSSITYGGRATQINEDGLILGFGGPGGERARVWPGGGGTGTELSLFAGEQGLNDLGHVVGRSEDSNHKAILWDGSGYEAIGEGQGKSMAHGVNNSDWAVGRAGVDYYQPILTAGNAWLWRPGIAATPLYMLAPSGWSMYSASDINDDGMVVGNGKHGSEAVGFWMAPHGIAHQLSGTVYGPDVTPVSGAQVRISGAGGEVAVATTDANGRYEETLPRGSYEITVLPDGDYLPDGLAGCEIVASTCRLGLSRNRTVDFYGVKIEVPVVPPPAPPALASSPSPTPSGNGSPPKLRVDGIRVSRNGTVAQIQLTVPGPGVITTSEAGGGASASASRQRGRGGKCKGAKKGGRKGGAKCAKKAASPLRTTRKRVREAGRVKATARLSKLGKRRLAKRGKVAVRVKVTYKPNGGKPFSRAKRVVFKRGEKRRGGGKRKSGRGKDAGSRRGD